MLFTCNGKHIFATSDTHGKHTEVSVPDGVDIMIHCGDACNDGDEKQLSDFFDWFSRLPIKHKIFVAGNHDLPFELFPEEALAMIPAGITYLDNSGITLEGIRFYGVQARPWMYPTAVPAIQKVDILLSHGAPYGFLDENKGCNVLTAVVQQCKPQYHLFGHIHSYGGQSVQNNQITSMNVCFPSL